MEKTINVGGRLHNPVVGGALTGANEIKDDTKGKMQSVINQETDAELVRLDEAKQEKLTFDQTPTEGSTNPVTSGGVYAADAALQQAIEAILLLIPSAASALNQLADKAFVNSSISTATATFRGTYNLVTDLGLTVSATHQQIATALASVVSTADNNDYCFVQIPVSDQSSDIRVTERYKFDGTSWSYEYDLNNSGFTADQWGAINSGITSVLVGKLGALPTAAELATMFNGKQNTLTFDTTPTSGSNNPVTSGGLYAKFATIDAMIPTGADANNKLVAESRLVAYVTTLINALDATFDVTSADGHVTLRMTQADGVITSVQILTSDVASASALATLGGRVSTAESDIDALQDAYAALTQSDVVIVNGTLPSSGQQQNIIYRQPDQDHTPPQFYSDYMWNGTTWVLMATYNNAIDPRPKKGSQNLVTSGGVFDNMGALDVSELNATENPHTLATYANLSAAIAAIPSDYQKGGMSIKFVHTPDNKYIQYRFILSTFTNSQFTNPANWVSLEDTVITNVSPFTSVAPELVNVVPRIEISVGKIEHLAYKYALTRFYNMESYKKVRITRFLTDGTSEYAEINLVDGISNNTLYFGGNTDVNHVSWANIYIDLSQFSVTAWDGTMYIKSENVHLKYDSVPTNNSENLVVSGGVKSYVDKKDNSDSVFFKTDGYNYTDAGSNMPLMVKSLEITDKDYFEGYIWPQYIFNYSSTTTPPRSNFTLNHTSEDGQTTTSIVVEGADNGGHDINHQGIITHNLLVGEVVIGKIAIDWDLYKGLEFSGNQTNRLLKVKRSCYKIVGSQGITKANDYSVKDDTKHIIKVDAGGHGDFTTITAAVASIVNGAYNNQYEVVVFPGVYYENGIHVPAYTHIHGLAPNTVVVSSKLQEGQTTLPVFEQEYASSKLSNMRINSHTGYCIHFDRALDGCSIKNENLYLFRDSQSSGDITGGGSFKDGTLYEWIGCTFDGRASNYGGTAACHTNVNANYENLHLIYRDCKFIDSALRVGSVGGFGHCVLEVYNCVFVDSILGCWISPNVRSLDEPWSYIVPNYEWQIIGGNNKGMAVYATSDAEALQVIADTRVEGQTIKLGGSALADIFGPIIRYSKGGNLVLKANAIGIYRVKDEQAGTPGYSEQRDVYQLWKRLGNCSVTNKTLTVQIDDGAVQTYTFNKDYLTTKDSETDILAAINAVLTGCTIQKYVSGQVDGWQNVNLIEKIQVTAATDLRFGRWVTKDGNIATSVTPAEDILGIAVSNTPKGEYADVWTGNSWYSYSSKEVGANYGSSDYGEIVKNATITLAVAKTQNILERL